MMHMIWDKFTKQELDPPRTARVGKRWIESGQVKGKIIDGVPWVDMEAWRESHPQPQTSAELAALELLA